MSSQLTQCRQGLAKALGQAVKPLPEVSCCSAAISGPGPIFYVSCPLSPHHLDLLHNLSFNQTAHNPVLTWHRDNCGCVCVLWVWWLALIIVYFKHTFHNNSNYSPHLLWSSQESRHDLEALTISVPDPEQQDLPACIGQWDIAL